MSPSNREMAGEVLRERKEKHQKATGIITIIPAEGNTPAYRLGITSVKVQGSRDKIRVRGREE